MDILSAGGLLLLPIIVCGLLSAFIVIERVFYFRAIDRRDEELEKSLDLAFAKYDYVTAETLCTSAETPLGIVLKKAIQSKKKLAEADMREVVQNEMDLVVPMFDRWIGFLSTIANVAMLLGLLGTVIGNIRAFSVLGEGGSLLNQEILAEAIAQSLVTTAAGLIVAIPTFVAFGFLSRASEKRISEMERFVTTILLKLTGRLV
mgnify:CR=1 FL=1